MEMAYHIATDSCPCGLERCPDHHRLSNGPAKEKEWPLFVWRAVAGGLQANAIAGGMLYRLVLHPEKGMLVARVALRECQNPACGSADRRTRYEGDRCPDPDCGHAFSPGETKVVAEDRLFIQGVYHPHRWWACGDLVQVSTRADGTPVTKDDGTPTAYSRRSDPHYHPQRACRTVGGSAGVKHAADGRHDRCPWQGCPSGNPSHTQQSTTLWGFHGPTRDLPPGSPAAPVMTLQQRRAEACREWFEGLPKATQARVRLEAKSAGMTDDVERFITWLLAETGGQGALPEVVARTLGESLRRADDDFGLEAEEDRP